MRLNGHNRLSIPFNNIENDFPTGEEKQYLLGEDEKRNKLFLEVKIVQPSLEVETVKLCRTVQLWGFRVDQELCLALVKVPRNRAA
ncbi:hypothetical protein SASPL_141700 [Salvia splendens]|uniref:Uncharacterized protein n=1 Tax=Salvia splendens TaxID=180675 RepID=A0A8X8Z834_SALSN|nr:hypothetical protein SASPL_141700 [Salvia splendens]